MPTFKFYKDAAGASPYGDNELFRMAPGENKAAYFLSTDVTRNVQVNADPGVENITFSFSDNATGSLIPGNVKMASTEGDLGSAPYDGTLIIGPTLAGGAANVVTVWLGNDSAEGVGVSVVTQELVEDDI